MGREKEERKRKKRKRDEVRDEKVKKIKFLDGSDNLNLSSFPTESIADSFCFSFFFLSLLSFSPSLPPVLMISSPSTSGRKGHLSFFAYHPRKKTCLEEISFHFFCFLFLSFSFISFLSLSWTGYDTCVVFSQSKNGKKGQEIKQSQRMTACFFFNCVTERKKEGEKERRTERKEERKK